MIFFFFLAYRKGSLPNGVHSKRRPECAGRIRLMALTALSVAQGCRKARHSHRLLWLPHPGTAYLLEWVSCHDTKDQPPGPHLPQGMKRMPPLSLLLCPAFLQIVLCPLPLYPVVFSFQSIGNFTQSMLSGHTEIFLSHSLHHCQIRIKWKRTRVKQ